MNKRSLRVWSVPAVVFVGVLLVGSLPWPGLRQAFNGAFWGGSNLLLARLSFGHGGRAWLGPVDARNNGEQAGPPAVQNVAADTVLQLRIVGRGGQLGLGLNLRREAYLPLLLFVAIVLAAPIPVRAKAHCLIVGTPIVLVVAFGAIWCLSMCTFALHVMGVYQLGAHAKLAIDLVYRILLLPPGNRFLVPLAMGLGLAARELRRRPTPLVGHSHVPEPHA